MKEPIFSARSLRSLVTRTAIRSGVSVLVAGAAVLVAPRVPAAEEGPWLNARECGASGSDYQTTATTVAGSKEITAANAGDFQAGQGILVSQCHPHFTNVFLWGPRGPQVDKRAARADELTLRGYDGSLGPWTVYILDIDGTAPVSFRWSDDMGRTWKGVKVPITHDWQKLNGGTEVRFGQRDWEAGYAVTFHARDQLDTTIERIRGNVLTLREAPTAGANGALVRHTDTRALQAAIGRALHEKLNLRLASGHYRLTKGLMVRNASGIVIEGAAGTNTLLDISEGTDACFDLRQSRAVTLRSLRMVGHTGFDGRDQMGRLKLLGVGNEVWGQEVKFCMAVYIQGVERVLVEDCHASRMATEAFASGGPTRATASGQDNYSKQVTYLRSSATDCARNGFNDVNCGPENTSVLFCRIEDVGGCAWEGASRFVKFIGNYVRNAGPVAMGNAGLGTTSLEPLGIGQHIVADNVFEEVVPYGLGAIVTQHGATQVIITHNQFINFDSTAVEVRGYCDAEHFPSRQTIVTGNSFDMTAAGRKSVARHAILVSASDTIVSDNQIFVRGGCDPLVTGICLREPALNVLVHDNQIRNCGWGIATARVGSRVTQVVNPTTFAAEMGLLPVAWPGSHLYRDWGLVWRPRTPAAGGSTIEAFDPASARFTLREPRQMNPGDQFEVVPPSENWSIHHNTIADCAHPAVLDSYGGETTLFTDNVLLRGSTAGVQAGIEVRGAFHLERNHLCGFDEPGAAALFLYPDPLGRPCPSLYWNNLTERCPIPIAESRKGLWEASTANGNLFLGAAGGPVVK